LQAARGKLSAAPTAIMAHVFLRVIRLPSKKEIEIELGLVAAG
jgi:hypothetical protein